MEGDDRLDDILGEDLQHLDRHREATGYSRADPFSDEIRHVDSDGRLTGYSQISPWTGDLEHRDRDGKRTGYSRPDPFSDGIRHVDSDGHLAGYTRRSPWTGDLEHSDRYGTTRGYSRPDPFTARGERPAITGRGGARWHNVDYRLGPYVPSGPSVGERLGWAALPTVGALLMALWWFADGYVSGREVLLYPVGVWVAFWVGMLAKRSPSSMGLFLWFGVLGWIFVRAIVGAF